MLSNVYGHALDALWAKESSHLGSIVRYADDAVILCRSEADAQHAYQWLQRTAQALKLVLHPDKTRIVDLRDGANGFDFRGFHLHMVRSRKYGKWSCQRWPSGSAMAAIRAKVKATTAPPTSGNGWRSLIVRSGSTPGDGGEKNTHVPG